MFSLRRDLKERLIKLLSGLFVLQALIGLPIQVATTANATVATCTSSQFTVEAKHNSVFYFDDGTPITSNYAQYRITNAGGAALTDHWVALENFSGGKLSIASQEVAAHKVLSTFGAGTSVNMYWYLTASGVSTSA